MSGYQVPVLRCPYCFQGVTVWKEVGSDIPQLAMEPPGADVQEDIRSIFNALGLGDGARPYSCHEAILREIIPAIQRLRSGAAA